MTKILNSCVVIVLCFFYSCQSDISKFQEKIIEFAKYDNEINEREYKIIVEYIKSNPENFSKVINSNGDIDTTNLVNYLIKLAYKNGIKLSNKKIWHPNKNIQTQKTILNIFIENSVSMDGYVKGITEFEQTVYNYITDIKISDFTDSLNLFYINSDIIPQGSDIGDFIEKLEPASFKQKGGKRGVTDISNLLKSVFNETASNEIAILVTDGIFSPGKGKDAEQYLVNQQIGIKNNMAEYLKRYPNLAVIIYQLSSTFDGMYYNREDKRIPTNESRPYYIWIIGNTDSVNELVYKVPEAKFKRSGVQNIFSITAGPKLTDYAIKMGSGNFDLDKTNSISSKTTINGLKKDTRGKQNAARFSVNVDFSGFLLDDNYLSNSNNYEMNIKDYSLTIDRASDNKSGYSHQLNFSSQNVHKGNFSVKLKSQIPLWVEQINDDDGTRPVKGKTYGIKYQIHGIYEAFTINNNYYTEIKIKIE